jgi:HMW1C N-terminal/HMW1 domain 2
MMSDRPSLPALERLVTEHRHQDALRMTVRILQAINASYGCIDPVATGVSDPGGDVEEVALIFATRFAAALGHLLTEPQWQITMDDYRELATHYRWIDLIFSLSGFRTSDHFISLLGQETGGQCFRLDGDNFLRLLALLSVGSTIVAIDFEEFWRLDRHAASIAFFYHLSSRYVFSRRAYEFRERLLEWISPRLNEVTLANSMLARLPEVYMHCSYAATPSKHLVKRPLLEQMRRACVAAGVVENPAPIPARSSKAATIVVVGERFSLGHAIFRAFSRPVRALRERFRLVGVLDPNPTGTPIADFFDECIAMPQGEFLDGVLTLAAAITSRKPAVIFYPSIGMVPQVVALAALRLAPIQCASYGHMATTMSPAIDYMILPEDLARESNCFSERVLALPKAAMPFVRPASFEVQRRPFDGTVRVAISATIMKLNPLLFDAIARIERTAATPLEFHFLSLGAVGLAYCALARSVRDAVPRACVSHELPFEQYIARLAECDLFLSPFPYGNTTSTIDAVLLGLPGVCLDGREAHAHSDAALFARIGLPSELSASSVDAYVAAAVRLIDDEPWRRHCSERVQSADLDAAFFTGDAGLFAAAIEELIWPSAG